MDAGSRWPVPERKSARPCIFFRNCKKKGTNNPRCTTKDKLTADAEICIKLMELLVTKAPMVRQAHFKSCIKVAEACGDQERVTAILDTMHQQEVRKSWQNTNWSTKAPLTRSVLSVKMPMDKGDEESEEFKTKTGVHMKVSTQLVEHFHKVFTAQYYKGKLFDNIAFIEDTEYTRQIMEGTYAFPEDTDLTTRLLPEETAVTFEKLSGKKDAACSTSATSTPRRLITIYQSSMRQSYQPQQNEESL